jgi:hypothetical protein
VRVVPALMTEIWQSEDKTGPRRPVVRATVQKTQLRRYEYDTALAPGDFDHQRKRRGWFTSIVMGEPGGCTELRNIRSYTWTRSVNQDVAECTITLKNTELTPLGEAPPAAHVNDFDRPGWMTYNRGDNNAGTARWGFTSDTGWNGKLVPDRLVKTYEGYGADGTVPPAHDPNLLQSGVWLIDSAEYSHDGDIVLNMRDVGSLLIKQIVFPPVVPYGEYPLEWETIHTEQVETRDALGGNWVLINNTRTTGTSSSNTAFVGSGLTNPPYPEYVGANGGVEGHHANHVLEVSDQSYWLSSGQGKYTDFVWWQADLTDTTTALNAIRLHTYGGPYKVFISLHNGEKWLGRKQIPYEAGEGPGNVNINADIPFVKQLRPEKGMPEEFLLNRAYGSIAKIRITFTALRHGGVGVYPFRAGLRNVHIFKAPTRAALSFGPGTMLRAVGNYHDYCMSSDTEVLTKRGWLTQDQVEVGDETLAIDPATGLSGWQVIEGVFREHRRRTMLAMESRVHSSLTTPDHRWLITDHLGRRDWRTTETLGYGHSIPLAAQRVDLPQDQKYTDAFVELVAWFWTEGWTHAQGGCVNAYLAQSRRVNPAFSERIEAALRLLAGEPGQRRGREGSWSMRQRPDGVVTYACGQDITKSLLAVAPEKVVTPEFLTALTGAQLGMFVETSIDADGWRKDGGRFLSQASEERIRSFQFACSLAGIPTSVRRYGGIWHISLLRRRSFRPASAKRTQVDYDGIIWCPTLKHHNWLARRNGKVFFTGNTDIVKWACAWGGFWWPSGDTGDDFIQTGYTADAGTYQRLSFAARDPRLPKGRVWGDMMNSGVAGVVGGGTLTLDLFDKKPLMDMISYVRDILGFVFFIDETGGVVWRMPNWQQLGNYLSPGQLGVRTRSRTGAVVQIDENETLISYSTTLSSENMRERIFVGNTNGNKGVVIKGFNPYHQGFRRVAGYTDMHFKTKEECRVMADMIAARQMFDYRRSRVTIKGYPAIQIDDQVRIFERVTNETYYHYVETVTSSLDMETGQWDYELETHWLGEHPSAAWVVRPDMLDTVTQAYLGVIDTGSS